MRDLQSRNTYTVDDVDVAIECWQVGSDYLGVSNAEALDNNAHFHPEPQKNNCLLVEQTCA